ncbi:MAG: restriction endonuclease [Candidatus Bathyarchaeota archaeon]|nr:restriction endonuclease [Candidatus Bathyarchaeota archaeon]
MRFQTFSYRFAEQVLNSKLRTKKEIENIIGSIRSRGYSRPGLNEVFRTKFLERNWKEQPQVFEKITDIAAKIDYLKDRVGVEVAFSHSSFIGIDLLKFQALSYSNLDKIDVGVYITVTRDQRRKFEQEYNKKWQGSLTFEKVCKYLPHFRSAIQVPVFVFGIEE